jgi:hypothetical protein
VTNATVNCDRSNQRGIPITPEAARARAKRELAKIAENVGCDLRTDEFLDQTLFNLEAEALVLRVWRYLHKVTCGAGPTPNDAFAVCDAVRWRGLTIKQAALERFPQLRDEIDGEDEA